MTLLKEKEELICRDVLFIILIVPVLVGPCCRRSGLDKCWLNSPFLRISCCGTEQRGRTESVVFLELVYVEMSEPCWPLMLPQKRDSQQEPSKFSMVLLGLKIELQSRVPYYPADVVSHKCNLNSCFLIECTLLIAQKSVLFFSFIMRPSFLFVCGWSFARKAYVKWFHSAMWKLMCLSRQVERSGNHTLAKNATNDSTSVSVFFPGRKLVYKSSKCDSKWGQIFLAQMFKSVLKHKYCFVEPPCTAV